MAAMICRCFLLLVLSSYYFTPVTVAHAQGQCIHPAAGIVMSFMMLAISSIIEVMYTYNYYNN